MEIFIVRFCETLGKFLSNYIVKKVEFPFLWTSWLIQYLYKGIFNEFLPSFLEIRGFDTEHKLFALAIQGVARLQLSPAKVPVLNDKWTHYNTYHPIRETPLEK